MFQLSFDNVFENIYELFLANRGILLVGSKLSPSGKSREESIPDSI